MVSQKIIFSCDHVISKLSNMATSINLVRSSAGDEDIVVPVGKLVRLLYAYLVPASGQVINYKPGIDFQQDGNNIKWISAHKPADQAGYTVEALVASRSVKDYIGNPADCERCAGQGWYVNKSSSAFRAIDRVAGINKLVQDYIKILYTEKDSTGYGTVLLSLSGAPVFDENAYLSDVASAINDASNQLKKIQSNFPVGNVSNEELLYGVDVLSMSYERSSGYAYISIKLVSVAGSSSAVINFKL